MKRKYTVLCVMFGVLLSGCNATESDVETLEGKWTNEDGWGIEFFAPVDGETGDIELTKWNGYDGTRLGEYECHEESQRLNLQYPDNWNIEIMEDTYTYEFIDDNTLMLYPDGDETEGVEYIREE